MRDYSQIQDFYLRNYAKFLQQQQMEEFEPVDAFDFYLKALGTTSKVQRIQLLVQALELEPLLWCAWLLLGQESQNWGSLLPLVKVDTWMSQAFVIYCANELYGPQQDGLKYDADGLHSILDGLKVKYPKCRWFDFQRANLFYHMRSFDECAELFKWLCEIEPNNFSYTPMYSNVLFVQDDAATLSQLCQHLVANDAKCLREETCYVLGNYYSLKSNALEAINMFQRCVKLGGSTGQLVASAYTLMGHEYIECRNTDAALEAYRNAIKISASDYRAWYGLGQTYEMLQMPLYSQYYFQKAAMLKPQDARMWMALANVHELCDDEEKAIDAYKQSLLVGSMVTNKDSILVKLERDDDLTWSQSELTALFKLFTLSKDVDYAKLLVEALLECEAFSSRTGLPLDVPELEYAFVVQAVIDEFVDRNSNQDILKLRRMLANFES